LIARRCRGLWGRGICITAAVVPRDSRESISAPDRSMRKCTIAEGDNGALMKKATGAQFTWKALVRIRRCAGES
jgi:hypothetical protein